MMSTLQHLFQRHSLPRLELLALAAHALNKPRSWLLAHDTDALNEAQTDAITQVFSRREAGEPVAYVLGWREFYGLTFKVSPEVLIPRAETELLVDFIVKNTPNAARILDLGTGSGAIAIAAAHSRPDLNVYAADFSEGALDIAAQNNAALVHNRVQLRRSDWCTAFAGTASDRCMETFDLIVSNPPYIAAEDEHLAQGDLRYEPAGALSDFADGYTHYRNIAAQAKQHLNLGGTLLLEHGWQQGPTLCHLLLKHGYTHIEQHYDAGADGQPGHARMISCLSAQDGSMR